MTYEILTDTDDRAEATDFSGARLAAITLLTDADATRATVSDERGAIGFARYCANTGQPTWLGSTLDKARR